MRVNISPRFDRSYKKLENDLQNDFDEKFPIFVENPNDQRLKTHKLKGSLTECYAFSLLRGYRVLFEYAKPDLANMLDVGSHDKYKQWSK